MRPTAAGRGRRRRSAGESAGTRGRARAAAATAATSRAGPAGASGGRRRATAAAGGPPPGRPGTSQAIRSQVAPPPRDRGPATPPRPRPTRWVRAPRPAGTSSVPREKSSRARASISARAAARNGSPKPTATPPATTARCRSRRLATDATARPTRRPVRSTTSGPASSGGTAGGGGDGQARRLRLQAAPPAAPAGGARRARPPRGRCGRRCPPPRRAGGRRGRCHRRRPSRRARPTKSATPAAAPHHPSPRARALASLSTNVGRPVASANLDRRGKSRQAGRWRGETDSPPAVIGPPQPTPQPTTSPLPPTESTTASRTENSASASAVAGVGAWAEATTSPFSSTRPAASFVPPMSSARTTSTPLSVTPPRYACSRDRSDHHDSTRWARERRGVPRRRLAGRCLARRRGGRDERPWVPTPGGGGPDPVGRWRIGATPAPDRGRAGFGGNWIFGPYTLLRPDVWWAAVIPTGNRRDTPPDLAVEVRSPSTWRYDLGKKREIYRDAGVAELWLVDPPAEHDPRSRRRPRARAAFDDVDRGRAPATRSPLPCSRASPCRSTTSSPARAEPGSATAGGRRVT